MFQELKRDFYNYIKGLGYNITDNGVYRNEFPWLMLRCNNIQSQDAINVRIEQVSFVVDIFSTYSGEKEILDIVQNIVNNLSKLDNPAIQFKYLKTCKILDDNSTGPVKKHGVAVFEFLLSGNYEEVEDETTNE